MRILHLLDGSFDWEQRLAVGQLLDRLDSRENQQIVASLDVAVPRDHIFNGTPIHRCPDRFGFGVVAAPRVRRLLAEQKVGVIIAWGARAASAAISTKRDDVPLIAEWFDPQIADRDAKLLRTVSAASRSAIACSTGTVQRRLIEAGVPADRCVLIRPGVDFGLINRVKQDGGARASLGIELDERVVMMSEPTSRAGFHDRVVWAHQLQSYLSDHWRLVIPGVGPETDRLRRLVRVSGFDAPVFAGDASMEQLIASVDVLVVPADGDVSTTIIAWAMASYVPVVATAVYSVAELIAHRNNGLLIKPQKGPGMAIEFVSHLRQMGDMRKEKESARGQAYEVFSIRRFVDQHVTLMNNLSNDREVGEGIQDSAVEG